MLMLEVANPFFGYFFTDIHGGYPDVVVPDYGKTELVCNPTQVGKIYASILRIYTKFSYEF